MPIIKIMCRQYFIRKTFLSPVLYLTDGQRNHRQQYVVVQIHGDTSPKSAITQHVPVTDTW